jgi:phosphoglycolate phosphatase
VRCLVLFDIDGTLLLTSGAGRRAITGAIAEELGDPRPMRRIRFDGKTDPQIIAELLETAGMRDYLTDERLDAICRRYLQRLAAELEDPTNKTTVMPGVHRLLERLEQERGVMLGLLTGNIAEGAALKLRSAGINPERFRVAAYGSDAAHRRELPPIAADRAARYFGRVPTGDEIVIIGDTPADVACGECINARAIAVATGGYTRAQLTACEPYAVFEDLSDTERVLTTILQ